MAKRKAIVPLPLMTQISLFDARALDAMLYSKVIEIKLLKDLIIGDRFSLKDTTKPLRITELQTISEKDTYIFEGEMQGRPAIVSVTTRSLYLVSSSAWDREIIIIKERPKNKLS